MSMAESEIKEEIKELRRKAKIFEDSGYATVGISSSFKNSADIIENLFEEIQQYRAIGTVSEFRELKEKATAKKLKHGVCPNCSTNNDMIIKNLGNPQGHKTIFCWNCGSCIDWSEGKE